MPTLYRGLSLRARSVLEDHLHRPAQGGGEELLYPLRGRTALDPLQVEGVVETQSDTPLFLSRHLAGAVEKRRQLLIGRAVCLLAGLPHSLQQCLSWACRRSLS